MRARMISPPTSATAHPMPFVIAPPSPPPRFSGRARPWDDRSSGHRLEGHVQDRIAAPVAVVEVPPLLRVHVEPLALHGRAQEVAAGALLHGPPGVRGGRLLREVVVGGR